jgi:hypothetical protein
VLVRGWLEFRFARAASKSGHVTPVTSNANEFSVSMHMRATAALRNPIFHSSRLFFSITQLSSRQVVPTLIPIETVDIPALLLPIQVSFDDTIAGAIAVAVGNLADSVLNTVLPIFDP